jgi:hypothetical protein
MGCLAYALGFPREPCGQFIFYVIQSGARKFLAFDEMLN